MLIDNYNRKIDYLRVSVTQRCNFRCQYCMPEKPFEWIPKEDLLSYEQMFKFIKVAISNGIKKIRITGGEPYDSSIDLGLTTNGYLLKSQAKKLKEAGLKRINISLDSLERETFWYLTKKDVLSKVLEGIDEAIKVGIKVKINSVVLKKINENEILSLYEFAKQRDIQIRFIEYMENEMAYNQLKTLTSQEILSIISTKYSFETIKNSVNSAAKLYKDNQGYIFGIIEPYDDSFCSTCNRIRLSAEGDLIPCLYYEDSINIKKSMLSKKDLENVLFKVVQNRPEKNKWTKNNLQLESSKENISSRAFYYTGG
jgi:cyclic pyranopterin phosphate synthase